MSTSAPAPPAPVKSEDSAQKQKRTLFACIRCRTRHIRCPGGNPCKKCVLAKTKCEFVEADKKIVVLMKYLTSLYDDIARLKKDNAMLRSDLKLQTQKRPQDSLRTNSVQPAFAANTAFPTQPPPAHDEPYANSEVIHPSLDKHGRLVELQTGEKVYVGLSSMTLFGLEIQNMVPSLNQTLLAHSALESPQDSPTVHAQAPKADSAHNKRETEILEKEGNAYKITLAKTNTRPGMSINFTLPSYSYAILLVETFINYNDGCFYFFNEGLVKKFLMNLYSGQAAENKAILRRNFAPKKAPSMDENPIKKDKDDDTILETIWFCKVLLIFAIGEMYLGTESDTHLRSVKPDAEKDTPKGQKTRRNTLPGSGFFYQASELFTGLFASGAIDNTTKDGGIEVMLLYAFYLQVADCTVASYFYFGLALRSTLILGWHVDADKENLDRFELEHRRRIWWTVYMYERMLSSKAGLPLSFADDSVSTELPVDFSILAEDLPRDASDVRSYYIFPPADYINNCVTITQINALILSCLYTKQPTANILPVVTDLVHKLMSWKNNLPDFLRIDFSGSELRISRLCVNLMTEYFQGMNLAVRPLLFHFATKKLKELQIQNSSSKYVDLTKYSKNVLTLLNASFQASCNTVKAIWALLPENMVALFGWMDREYLFTSASTLILFNASFGVHEATREHLDHALVLFTRMKKLGNYPAALRRAQLLKLIRVLDFNGVMSDLLVKHDDEKKDLSDVGDILDGPADFLHGFDTAGEAVLETPVSKPDASFDIPQNKAASQSHISQPVPEEMEYLHFGDTKTGTPSSRASAPSTSHLNNDSFNFNINVPSQASGDVYSNADLAGIEGLTYLDEEQKLWNEITNEAVWLHMPGGNPNQPPNSSGSGSNLHQQGTDSDLAGVLPGSGILGGLSNPGSTTNLGGFGGGGYSDIINSEFQDMME